MLTAIQAHLLASLRDQNFPDAESSFRAAAFILNDDRKLLEAAVAVLDERTPIQRIVSASVKRRFWVAPGAKGRSYVCFEGYCSCRSFLEGAASTAGSAAEHQVRDDSIKTCKHLVAIAIAESIKGLVKEQVLSDKDFVDLMCSDSNPKRY